MQEEKSEKSANIKSRVIEVANFKGISLEKFFSELGVTYGNFKGKNKESSLSSSVIERLHTLYPDINLSWLISGIGQMLANNDGGKTILGINNVVDSSGGTIISSTPPNTDAKDATIQHQQELIQSLREHISDLKKELERKDAVVSHLLNNTNSPHNNNI